MLETVGLCRQCHNAIHKFFGEKELGKRLNTLDKLREEPAIARFVMWVRKQR
jgi:hypothetical protein